MKPIYKLKKSRWGICYKKGNKMYFTNITKLKEDIIEKKLSEKDRFIYILLFVMLDTIFLELNMFPIEELNIIDYASSILTIVVTFLGTYFIYKANGGEEGDDFAGKYFSITWVRGIQFLLIFMLVEIIFLVLDSFLFKISEFNNDIVMFISISGFVVALYFYSYKDVLEVKAKEK